VERADHQRPAQKAFGQRPAAVGADRVDGVHAAATWPEDRHLPPVDVEQATLAERDLGYGPQAVLSYEPR